MFEAYKDDVLSGKLWKNRPVRGEHGEAKIEIVQGSKVHKQRPFYLHGTKADALERLLRAISMSSVGWTAE